jgi:mono/diheme cytochrome c family protein
VLLLVVPAAVLALAAVLIALVARSGGGAGGDPGASAAALRGEAVFTEAGCAGCHTLAAASATGTAGPDLDITRPDRARIERQVRAGGRGMPAFAGRLSGEEIAAVAEYVAASTATGGSAPVAGAFRPDGTTVDGCGDDVACLEQAFGNVAFRQGPRAALTRMDEGIAEGGPIASDCHRISHSIGAGGLARFGGDVSKALAAGTATCWSGYYHGVLERAFAGVADDGLGEAARDLCAADDIRDDTFVTYQCVHGLGHGLMIRTGLDLPGALAACDGLRTDWDRSSCTGGVFMENLSSSYGTTSEWLREDDPLYPCQAVAERHKLYCYLMVTSRVLPSVGWDWAKAAGWCRRAERDWVATCFQSLGRDASGNSLRDAAKIHEHCAVAGAMEGECLYGAARDMVSNDAGGAGAQRMCSAAPGRWRARCFEGVGTVLGVLNESRAARRAACARWAPGHVAACRRGAGA